MKNKTNLLGTNNCQILGKILIDATQEIHLQQTDDEGEKEFFGQYSRSSFPQFMASKNIKDGEVVVIICKTKGPIHYEKVLQFIHAFKGIPPGDTGLAVVVSRLKTFINKQKRFHIFGVPEKIKDSRLGECAITNVAYEDNEFAGWGPYVFDRKFRDTKNLDGYFFFFLPTSLANQIPLLN